MHESGTYALTRIVLAAVLAVGIIAPARAVAAPVSAASIEAKKTERALALAQLDAMRTELDDRLSAYTTLTEQIADTRAEVASANAEVVAVDASLEQAQAAFTERVVQLYRGDRVSMVSLLLDSRSVSDFMVRANYLVKLTSHDVALVRNVRSARNESLWVHDGLQQKLDMLTDLQYEADAQRKVIESALASQQKKARALGTDLAALIREKRRQDAAAAARTFSGAEPGGAYSPDTLITDANFRASGSMSAAEVQLFLDQQSGILGRYSTKDHLGRKRTAAEMIAEAAVAFNVSPKVILVSLQKEQSLLSKSAPSQRALDWALGCGKADSHTYTQYQGFGNQIWWGAQKLDKNTRSYSTGASRVIDGSVVRPTNEATWSLYKYTPHLKGTMSFWLLYWRYFGDPLA